MARVVRQRNNPPILLIVFVFLFIVAAAVAVLMYMRSDEATKSIAAGTKTKREDNKTIKELKSWNAKMGKEITGREGFTTKAALSQIESTYTMLKEGGHVERGGLLPTILVFDKNIKSQKKLVGDKDKAIQELTIKLDDLQESNKTKTDTYHTVIDKWTASNTKLREDLAKVNEQRKQDKTESKKKYDGMLETAQSEKAELLDEQEKMIEQASKDKREIRRIKKENEELRNRINPPKSDDEVFATSEIIRVTDDGDCYVGLGSKDKIKPGLTFSVYQKGEKDNDKTKGTLRVIKVDKDFSVCEIVELKDKNSPIVRGDVVANIAFHNLRPPVFVIIGDYDLHGKGTSAQDGSEELVLAVKYFGGKIEDEVTYRTDFLVVGKEPLRPKKPSEDALPAVHRVYQRNMKKYDTYSNSKAEAKTMRIPILNLNRFLTLTGYTPEKAPE